MLNILGRIFHRKKVFMCKKCGKGYPHQKGETAIVLWWGTYCRTCGMDQILDFKPEYFKKMDWREYIHEIRQHFLQIFIIGSDPNIIELEVRHKPVTRKLLINIAEMDSMDKKDQRTRVRNFYLEMLDIPKLHIRRGRVPAIPHDM